MLTIDEFVSEAHKLIGVEAIKYDYTVEEALTKGNNPETGFDCSGIWQYLLLKHGFDLYSSELNRNIRFTREFFDLFGKPILYGEHKKGDFVFFSYSGAMPTHMGLYIGDNQIIHKGFCDVSLVPTEPSGDYHKRIILSNLEIISDDRRNAGRPIKYIVNHLHGPQKYFTNPIGFKRFLE